MARLSTQRRAELTPADRALLRLAGALLVGGFLIFFFVTALTHPKGDENNHPVIFQEYADSDAWVVIHFAQFVGILIALGGFVVLYRVLAGREEVHLLSRFALASTVAAAAVWAALQAVDGVALKETVEAWADASGAEKSSRFGDAETMRWTEWGLQAYFRLLLGLAFVLFGLAVARTGIVARWLGWAAVLGGLLYAAVGIAVGHTGLDKPGALPISLLFLTFMVGLFLAGRGGRGATDLPGRYA